MTNKKSAKLFVTDTEKYLAKRNADFSIILTEDEKNAILALIDDDISEALKNKDLQLFVTLCKEKGYLNTTRTITKEELREHFKTQEDFEKFMELYNNPDSEIYPMSALIFPVAATLAIAAVGVAVYGVAALWTISWAWTHGDADAKVVGDEPIYSGGERGSRIMQREPVLQLWFKAGNEKVNYSILHSELITKQVDEIMEVIISSDTEGTYNLEKTKEFITANLEGFYGLRK